MISVVMLSVIMLSVVMLSVVMLSVIMLSVLAPNQSRFYQVFFSALFTFLYSKYFLFSSNISNMVMIISWASVIKLFSFSLMLKDTFHNDNQHNDNQRDGTQHKGFVLQHLARTTISIISLCHYLECCNEECHILFIVMLYVIMLWVIRLSFFLQKVIILNMAVLGIYLGPLNVQLEAERMPLMHFFLKMFLTCFLY